MKKSISIGIATCGRPQCINKCIKSIEKYVSMPYTLIIYDNTKAFTNEVNVDEYLDKADIVIEEKNKKTGCCESNQAIADVCETDYLLHLDDDCYLTSDIVSKQYNALEKGMDIVGTQWYDMYPYGHYRHMSTIYLYHYEGDDLYVEQLRIPYKDIPWSLIQTDECLHSMMVNMDTIYRNGIGWDVNLPWKGDRLDFFLQCKQKNAKLYNLCKEYVIHDPKPYKYGSISYEFDGKSSIEYFEKKWNVKLNVAWSKDEDKPR